MRVRVAMLCAGALLASPSAAQAGDPIMPLAEVRAGMQCSGWSVVRGTEVTSFDVEVVDVVSADSSSATRILVRASGEAIAATGLGAGFSGSPVYCDGRVIGAISQSIGQYGNDLALATPIEEMLGETPDPPTGARRDSRLLRSARPMAAPLTVTGLDPRAAARLTAAGRRVGRLVLAAPAGPRATFPPQVLRPGAAVSAGYSTGDLAVGAIGTVTYVDGDRIWAFGHPLDGAGARSLLLQDAYVFTVVGNPLGTADAMTYKLAAPGHDLGTVTNDALAAIVGRTGGKPRTIPVRAVATDEDRGRAQAIDLRAADEWPLSFPSGVSPLALTGPLALIQATTSTLRGLPARLTARMCMRISLAEREDPIRFCNRYVAAGVPGDTGGLGLALNDYSTALEILESYSFGPLAIEGVESHVELRRGTRQAYMLRASAPRRARRGTRIRVRVVTREVNGPRRVVRFPLRVPRSLRPGLYELQLAGTGSDSAVADLVIDLGELLEGDEEVDAGDPGPRTVDELAEEIEALERYDGVSASFTRPGRRREAASIERAHRDRDVRISGRTSVRVRVR